MRTLSWVTRIPEILGRLRCSPTGPLDRAEIEGLFSVGKARAVELMHEFGAAASAAGLTVDRDRLIAHLEEIERSGDLRLNAERRNALEAKLEPYRQMRQTPYAEAPVPARRSTYGACFETLPAAIRFEPGRLVIEHQGPEDLWAKLFLLGQAGLNDQDAVNGAIAAPATPAAAYELDPQGQWIKCLACGATSHNPHDVANRYCGYCHEFLAGDTRRNVA